MGINYNKDNKKLNYLKLSKSIYNFSKKNNCKIIFEPGRSIVGDTAVLLTKVIYVKNNQNKKFINNIENEYSVEKELLLSLMAIETNYGNYLGKMDIISSLATLSFDKRRSEFFSNELLIALNLIDQKLINPDLLYGSWAGAFGNFQFMPSTIKNYAVDYDLSLIHI